MDASALLDGVWDSLLPVEAAATAVETAEEIVAVLPKEALQALRMSHRSAVTAATAMVSSTCRHS